MSDNLAYFEYISSALHVRDTVPRASRAVSVIGDVGWWLDLPQPPDKIDQNAALDDRSER